MNERIKELLDKLKFQAAAQVSPLLEGEEWQRVYSEKFAELIVRECMEQVWYSREDGINGNVSEVIKERIKQHFGVTE